MDLRFYRCKYDAAKILDTFGARLRQETDMRTLNQDLIAVIGEMRQLTYTAETLRPNFPPC